MKIPPLWSNRPFDALTGSPATLVAAPFDDPQWLFEVKWDGFRVQAVVADGAVRTLTRGCLDAARYCGSFLEPPTWIAAKRAIVDGEVIAVDDAHLRNAGDLDPRAHTMTRSWPSPPRRGR